MTAKLRAQISLALVASVAGLVGVILGVGVAWGTLHQRVARLEGEFSEQRPILLRIDRGLGAIEQCIRDMTRRLDRLEDSSWPAIRHGG